MENKKKSQTFDNKFYKIFIPFIIGFILIMFLPILFTKFYWFDIDFTKTGNIGDTFGGVTGPFIATAAAVLTFLAFWVQYKANEDLRKDLKIERFENKFYEALQLHKSNVSEMNIADKITGRKCFVPMFYELRCVYQIVEDFYKSDTSLNQSKIDLMKFSYSIFFYGIGLNSEKNYVRGFNICEKSLFDKVKPFLEKIQRDYELFILTPQIDKYFTYGLPNSGIPNDKTVYFYYYPFDGHANRLGHYFRHLFQSLSFIASRDFLEPDEKYDYFKTFRAQISNFEQLHIYYNALAWFDKEWREFLTDYRFIKNLPILLADFDKKPEVHFQKEIDVLSKDGIAMFEWHE